MSCMAYLLDVLQNHVAVTIEGLDSSKKLPVVSAADKNLCVVLDRLLKDREWTSVELFFFELAELVLGHLTLWLCAILHGCESNNYALGSFC